MAPPGGGAASCARNGIISVNAIGTLGCLCVTLWGIIVVNQYTVSQRGLATTLNLEIADTASRVALLTAMDVSLQAALEAGDADLLATLVGVNDTLATQIAYLAGVLNVTSGGAQTFIELVEALVVAGLAERIQTINSVPGSNDTLDNIDVVSLSVDHLLIVPSPSTNSIGIGLQGVIVDVQAGNAGITVSFTGNNTAVVSNAGVLSAQGCVGDVTFVGAGGADVTVNTTTSTVTIDVTSAVTTLTDTVTALATALSDAQAAIVALTSTVAGITTTATPTGAIMPWSATNGTAPAGYLLCDGGSYPEVDYAALFAIIGTTYGGSGGNFSVPDLRGRTAVGVKSSGVFNVALGTVVGAETHALVTGELAAHTHTGTTTSDGAHNHGGATGTPNVTLAHEHDSGIITGNDGALPGAGTVFYTIGSVDKPGAGTVDAYRSGLSTSLAHTHGISSDGAHTHTFTSASTGSGTAHNNVQPSIVMNYIIKT